jgi:hypothetical protein
VWYVLFTAVSLIIVSMGFGHQFGPVWLIFVGMVIVKAVMKPTDSGYQLSDKNK